MRHKYATQAIVLGRAPLKEAGMRVTLLTPDLGLLHARAEGIRRPGAKLAHALQTFHESDVMLVRGKDGWRITGAMLTKNRFIPLSRSARMRAGRVAGLLLRLVHGETADPMLFGIFTGFIEVLPDLTEERQDAAECLAALRILSALGLDSGDETITAYDEPSLLAATEARRDLVLRINRGISASGM